VKKRILFCTLIVCVFYGSVAGLAAQESPNTPTARRPSGGAASNAPQGPSSEMQALDSLRNEIEMSLWMLRAGDFANVDFDTIASSKPARMSNPTGQGAGNAMNINFFTFIPKKLAPGQKAPLIVFIHGGVHDHYGIHENFHWLRELVQQGYIVVAPEYRGTTGYGAGYYNQIDYGGAEVDDVHDVRDWAVANLPQVDPSRIGIVGHSHGGYITLMAIFRWPHDWNVAYAGCPVSDLVMRMGYKGQAYQDTFASFMGKSAEDNPMEYRRRSPVFYADKLDTPLLIHTNTTDQDVNVMEVEHLIDALKANGKKFEYKIYQNAPGGHTFNEIDTALAVESRKEVYAFLARYLKP
jgi:dipeptidyl aminopeptidase/acylaminoacyl peptidase